MDFTLEDWEELDLDLDQRDLFWDLLLLSKHHLDPSHCFLPVTHRILSSDAQCTGQHLVTEAPPALSTDSAGPQEPTLVPAGFLHPLPFLLVTGAFPWAAGSGGRGCRPLCPHSSALTHPPQSHSVHEYSTTEVTLPKPHPGLGECADSPGSPAL